MPYQQFITESFSSFSRSTAAYILKCQTMIIHWTSVERLPNWFEFSLRAALMSCLRIKRWFFLLMKYFTMLYMKGFWVEEKLYEKIHEDESTLIDSHPSVLMLNQNATSYMWLSFFTNCYRRSRTRSLLLVSPSVIYFFCVSRSEEAKIR